MEQVDAKWRKSTFSGGNGGNCVEVGTIRGEVVARDTKDNGHGPVLAVGADAWRRMIADVKAGKLS
jgi:hypothetical protein